MKIDMAYFCSKAGEKEGIVFRSKLCLLFFVGFFILIIYLKPSDSMSIKKINGYRIFLNDKLGKGAYGSVLPF